MTHSRFRPLNPQSPFKIQEDFEQASDTGTRKRNSSGGRGSNGNGAAMRIIVPLQGVVQGRGGLVLGSVIPCALFYFLQLYLKRNRSPSPSPPPTPSPSPSPSSSSGQLSELPGIPRSQSRSHLSPRGSAGPARISARASSIAKSADSPYYAGLAKYLSDPYDPVQNPDGVIQLGLAENRLSMDLVKNWIMDHLKDSLLTRDGVDLGIAGIAAYQPFDGLMELKMEPSIQGTPVRSALQNEKIQGSLSRKVLSMGTLMAGDELKEQFIEIVMGGQDEEFPPRMLNFILSFFNREMILHSVCVYKPSPEISKREEHKPCHRNLEGAVT